MFRYERNSSGVGLCKYINESIPVEQLNWRKNYSENLFLRISHCLRKRLIVFAFKHPDQSKLIFLESLSKNLFIYLETHENIILLGDFNMIPEDQNL